MRTVLLVVREDEKFSAQRREDRSARPRMLDHETGRLRTDTEAANAVSLSSCFARVPKYSLSPRMAGIFSRSRPGGRWAMNAIGSMRLAAYVAHGIGVSEFISDVMPQEKADVVRRLQGSGRTVAMVGDGVNDSVALALADVGIAMRHGADITREAADVVLMEDHMGKLIGAIDISRQATKLIKQNIFIVTGLNTVALGLSIPPGLISPATTALISNGSAILASVNSMRPVMKY